MQYHNNSIATALVELFPDIGLVKVKLQAQQSKSFILCVSHFIYIVTAPWSYAEIRRKFFETYARKNGFDPLVAANWYSQSQNSLRRESPKVFSEPPPFDIVKLMNIQGLSSVLFYHNASLTKALLDLFPDIGLDAKKLQARKGMYNFLL